MLRKVMSMMVVTLFFLLTSILTFAVDISPGVFDSASQTNMADNLKPGSGDTRCCGIKFFVFNCTDDVIYPWFHGQVHLLNEGTEWAEEFDHVAVKDGSVQPHSFGVGTFKIPLGFRLHWKFYGGQPQDAEDYVYIDLSGGGTCKDYYKVQACCAGKWDLYHKEYSCHDKYSIAAFDNGLGRSYSWDLDGADDDSDFDATEFTNDNYPWSAVVFVVSVENDPGYKKAKNELNAKYYMQCRKDSGYSTVVFPHVVWNELRDKNNNGTDNNENSGLFQKDGQTDTGSLFQNSRQTDSGSQLFGN